MSKGVKIRPFRSGDQEAARELILSGLAERFGRLDSKMNPDLEDIAACYTGPGQAFLVSEVDGTLVGTGALITEAPGIGRIVRVSVHVGWRRRGLGKAIIQRLVSLAGKAGLRELRVETNHDWHEAIRLYQRCGFEIFDRDPESAHLCLSLYQE